MLVVGATHSGAALGAGFGGAARAARCHQERRKESKGAPVPIAERITIPPARRAVSTADSYASGG